MPDPSPPWYRRRLVLAGAAGGAMGLGQPPFSLEMVALLGAACAFVIIARTARPAAAFRAGWVFGTAYFALVLHWIVEPFLVDIARHGWMAPFALLFLSAGLALFWGAAAALARVAAVASVWGFALAWPAGMALAEWLRATVLTGFPWGTVGYLWVDTPVLAAFAWAGPFGVTFATLLLASLAGALALDRARWAWLGLPPAAAGFAVAIGWAMPPPPAGEADGPRIRLVQPNAPQHLKWDPAYVQEFYDRALSFTSAPGGPDLVVWPETSLPWELHSAGAALFEVAEAAQGAPVILGAQRREAGAWYNALAVIDPSGAIRARYDKHHLVPFGEYIPAAPVLRRFGLRAIADTVGGFAAGPGPQVIEVPGLGRALPLICYEAIFPQNIRAAPERPDVLLHITNDAWFGRIAGPQQHLAQARIRAAEFGLPVVRAANTGISAVIDARGRVTGHLPLGEAGFADLVAPPPRPPTLYARLGDAPALALALLTLGGAALGRRFSD